MKKLEKKLNVNAVGTTSSRPHFEGMAKEKNGITLIALIITIIVMLILVGVTINVALNGGIFKSVEDATTQKEKAVIYEQIVGAMKLSDRGRIIVDETYSDSKTILEKQGMTVSEMANGIFSVTGKKGTYKYQITETKIIMDPEESPEPPPEPPVDIVTKLEGLIGEGALGLLGEFNTTSYYFEFVKDNEKCKDLDDIQIYVFKDTDLTLLVDTSDNNKEYYLKLTAESSPIITGVGEYPVPQTKNSSGLTILTNYKDYAGLSNFEEGVWNSFLTTGEIEGGNYHEPGRLPASADSIMVNSNGTWEIPTSLRGLEYVLIPDSFEGVITQNKTGFINTNTLSVSQSLAGFPTVTIEDVTYYKVPWTGK